MPKDEQLGPFFAVPAMLGGGAGRGARGRGAKQREGTEEEVC